MLKYKANKFRIYPNKEQEIVVAKTIGHSRFIYNQRNGKERSYS
ncbi:helix-turn-helix domain-containing protein [Enterococcus durans]|nr:helix-turn-helix domain-containing protein [Enterococcus durans]MDT2835984.1 helix-turn-helix domain-containing protein [Enterococcus durans]